MALQADTQHTADPSGRFVPAEFLRLLGVKNFADVRPGGYVERRVTIMFCDIRDFTSHTEKMVSADAFGYVNSFLSKAAPAIHMSKGFVDKYIGDGFMALFPDAPEDSIGAAGHVLATLAELNRTRGSASRPLIRVGLGINTGMAMLGTVGEPDQLSTAVISDAVNLASRLEGLTKTYGVEIIISENTLYALSSHLPGKVRFLDRIRIKGKCHPQSIYEVYENDDPALARLKEEHRRHFEEAAAYYHLGNIVRARQIFETCAAAVPDDRPVKLYLERCWRQELEGVHEGSGELDGTLGWRNDFEVGVATIDSQHRQLVENMNRVAPLIRQGDASRIEELMIFVRHYADSHFRHEEGLMAESAYPFRDLHVAEHRRFIAYFLRLQADILSGGYERLFLIFKAQVFLADWFAHHSTGMDRHLAAWLLHKPEQAPGHEP